MKDPRNPPVPNHSALLSLVRKSVQEQEEEAEAEGEEAAEAAGGEANGPTEDGGPGWEPCPRSHRPPLHHKPHPRPPWAHARQPEAQFAAG